MDRLFVSLADMSDPRIGGGDSFCDRLSNRYTVFIMILFAILVTTKHYVGEPIACWCPDHFTDSWVDYTNQICWVQNTYYLPFEERIPKEGEERDRIGYYQWVGLILACQAVMFYMPRAVWRVFNKKSGIAVSTITDAAIECQRKADPDARDRTLRYMVKHMGRFLREVSRRHDVTYSKLKSCWWVLYGNYLAWLYIFMKLLYIGNVLGQLFLLNHFLGTDYHLYGIEVIERLVEGRELSVSHRFPRVTMCDFKIRVLGNIHRYSVQCALPVNLFNEKIFIFIWFWFVFVTAATVGSFLLWLWRAIYMPAQAKYLKARLIAMDKLDDNKKDIVKPFVHNYLRRDGVFLIRLVAKNSSDIIAAELICGLWDQYIATRTSREAASKRAKSSMQPSAPPHDVDADNDRKVNIDGATVSEHRL